MTIRHLDLPERTFPRAADAAQEIVDASGISVRLWRLYGVFWLVNLGYALLLLLQTPSSPGHLSLITASALVCVALYVWCLWPHPIELHSPRRSRVRRGLFVIFAIVVLALSLLDSPAWLWLLVCVSAVAGVIFPMRPAFIMVMALTLLALAIGVLRDGWLPSIPLALLVRGLGLDMIGLLLLLSALRQVHRQRQDLANLAVAEERVRVGRDLHDLLGQQLALITLKSELASRLSATDPARAAAEMRDVEDLARVTLREVRAAVAGYRQPSLVREVDGARQLLAAADISHTIEVSATELPVALDAILAWIVREGVTNVIRHSRARHCHIRISRIATQVQVEVTNDGVEVPSHPTGNGLKGLTERAHAAGGRLVAGPQRVAGEPGFRLWVTLPLPPLAGVLEGEQT